jgi:hypothetical protein
MPTTRARRLISLLTRSSGLVDRTLGQWLRGKAVKASTSVFASSTSGPIWGKAAASWPRCPRWRRRVGRSRPEYGGDHVLVGLGHQRQHVTGEVHPAWSYRAPERLPLALLAPRSAGGAGRTRVSRRSRAGDRQHAENAPIHTMCMMRRFSPSWLDTRGKVLTPANRTKWEHHG